MTFELRVGGGDDRFDQFFREVLCVLFVDGNIASRRFVRREGGEQLQARAVIDARGLEEQSVWRVQENRENLCGGQVTGHAGIGERAEDDDHAQHER
ncbi:MAG: hypothetical protein HND47_05735 [Chloroflexi bacterium]|nr:hypothetical protein [Chloroflexota bacterium]